MRAFLNMLRQHVAALRMLLIFTVVLGVAYPLFITLVAQVPGLQSRANGSQIKANGNVVGSKLLGQAFTDKDGNPLAQYFQSRPSAAGDGYDPTASSASNLGPESIVDTLPDPSVKDDTGKQSLLTQVCSRSLAIGKLEGVDGSRPFCTPDGVGAVLAVFWSGPGYSGTSTASSASTRPHRRSRSSPATRVSRSNSPSSVRTTRRGRSCRSVATPRRKPVVPGRRRDGFRIRPGSGDQPGLRPPAGASRGKGPRHQRRAGQRPGGQVHERDATSASSANLASTSSN